MEVSYATLAPGGIPDGGVARTVEATESIWVDVDKDGTVLGVEVIGEGNWTDGLVALAMQGRLRVMPASARQLAPARPQLVVARRLQRGDQWESGSCQREP
jgi:uncharacterized protein YuzE